jgi:hypothetical protein
MKPSQCTLLINSFPKIPRMQFKTWWFWRSQCHKANQTTLIIYINERRTTFAKPYGIKVRCSWECVREYNGNLKNILRTSWKIIGNIMRTWWEHNVNVMGTQWELTENTLGTWGKWKIPSFTFTLCKPKKYIGDILSLLIWLRYTAERRTTYAKAYGLK